MRQHCLLIFPFLVLFPLVIYAHGHSFNEHLPLEFIPNKGQFNSEVLFRSQSPDGEILLESGGFTYITGAPDNAARIHAFKHNHTTERPILGFHAYKVTFEGAKQPERVTGSKPQQHYYNFFLGNDSSRWAAGVHPFLNVDYTDLYAGIDLHVTSSERQLKYDFIVQPGADPDQIRLNYTGVDRLRIVRKNLEIITSTGTVTELKPYAYQYINNEKKEVPCFYRLKDRTVSYHFPEGYDASHTLIIDPTVIFARYTGSSYDNWGFTATYDNQGNFYAGGIVSSSQGGTGYIITPGAFQMTFAGGDTCGGNNASPTVPLMPCDIAISKYDASGNTLLYATYLGGSSNEQPHSMVVDNAGNFILSGRSCSVNFPVTAGAYNTFNNGRSDIIITKFDATGNIMASTYIGGSADDGVNISTLYGTITSLKHNYGDDARSEIIVDSQDNIYLASCTRSSDFPVTANAAQSTIQGGQDGVVLKFNPTLATLVWSTFLGGTNDDAAYVLALNKTQSHLFVGGGTASTDFLTAAPGGLFPAYMGGTTDGYIVKFQNSGTYTPVARTFLGQASYDQCYGVQVDRNNNVYAMGQTTGGTFPVTPGVYSNPNASQFIIKLDSNISTNIYSTVFGSGTPATNDISPVAFLVDTCEQVYISGWGGPLSGNGGNTNGMPITADAAQATTDGSDFYFIVLAKDALGLLYGSYMGSPILGEHVDGGTSRFDANGIVYQAICGGCGGSSTFPITTGPQNGSTNCNLVALKIAFELSPVIAQASANPDSSGCAPFTVQFQNNSSSANDYSWNFGDGSPETTQSSPTHTYTNPGVYTVTLIANNTHSCLVTSDTTTLTIIVDTSSIRSDFDYTIISSCDPYTVSFTNTSQYNTNPIGAANTTFHWDFGDGTSFSGVNPPLHQYADTGTYVVTLVMTDSLACNSPQTIQKTVSLDMFLVIAGFTLPDSICIGETVDFTNTSQHALSWHWDLGNGSTSGTFLPNMDFTVPGTFTIKQVASNSDACNKADSISHTITVVQNPIASFLFAPVIPITNEPTTYTNTSQFADSYLWLFGDGVTSTETHPVYMHLRSGTYDVCLVASNILGCIDTFCRRIETDIVPAIGVPTAFSPNGDGNNDILYVRGAAVSSVQFRVYNRWGEMVFETTDMNIGWDGTYKGKPQEMEAYAYTLYATFIDGTDARQQGNVTLLR